MLRGDFRECSAKVGESRTEKGAYYMGERMKVLVAYDGSDCADAALADLQRAGLPREVEASVFTVGVVFLPPPPVSSYEVVAEALTSRGVTSAIAQSQAQAAKALEVARAVADSGRDLLRSAFPHWEVRAEIVAGTPAWAIIEMAEHWPADLVVVGSHGRSALGRLLLGSVSKKVATEARNSVRVARCLKDKVIVEAPIRLLLCFDGSPSARAAVRAVARRTWPAGSTARVVAVAEFPPATPIGGLMPAAASAINVSPEDGIRKLREEVEAAGEDLGAVAGLHVSCEVMRGDPKLVLAQEAEKMQADCIFVGSRGLGSPIERFILGSVSAALINNAPCSVEVARA
jgi:nucleotide-binding universal stress UspA family protein